MEPTSPHNPYQDYLKEKHARFSTPVELIDQEVKKATGSISSSRNKLMLGEVNEVYDVVTEDRRKVIIRISRSEHPRFEAEKKAIGLARQAGVPAPEVLLVDRVSTDGSDLTFSIERKMDGVALQSLGGEFDRYKLKVVIGEAGRVLAKLHGVMVSSFGGLDRGEKDTYKSWSEFIYRVERKRGRIIEAGEKVGVDMAQIDTALKTLRGNEELYSNVRPHLLHGDFSIKHFMIKDDHLVGIIDFENCKGGDPVYDFAWFDYFFGKDIPLEWLKKGYAVPEVFGNNFDRKLLLYRLHLGLGFIDYYEEQNNKPGMDHTKIKLEEDLKNLDVINPPLRLRGGRG
ncbi:MAG: Aminoglycoside phosphotransferase [Candidatus Amesbacteria bacterium GW2011_GWA2_47_70]|nr:MAG: Aminoglycoside phosphotransferase [Candidatus Amesbacteria bacterium GW2011_GWA2_47_70]